MEFFRIRRDIPFMRHALVFNIVSLRDLPGCGVLPRHARTALLDRVHRRHRDRGRLCAGRRHRQGPHRGRAADVGEVQVQNFGSSRDVLIRVPVRADIKQADVVDACLRRALPGRGRHRRLAGRRPRASRRRARSCSAGAAEPVRLQRSEVVGPQVGRELAEDGAKALGLRRPRHHDLPGVPLRVEVLDRRHRRQPARRRHHPRLLRLLPVGVLALRAGGGAGRAGLLGQRVGRHLRPDPRVVPALSQDEHRAR